jgi:branched-chain amino acid transport system substrate-binding protein
MIAMTGSASRSTPVSRRAAFPMIAAGGIGLLSRSGRGAAKAYGPGVTDTEIKIGQTAAYSGPASTSSLIARGGVAYFNMVNNRGGVNGRKINLLSLDDAYSPPKTVEQVRRLVEQDNVLGMFGMVGAAPSAAALKYLNEHKVPQVFVFGGSTRFRDPQTSPWTIGADLAFANATVAYARFITAEVADPKIAVLYQNDDFGKDHLSGLRKGLGPKAETAIIKTASFEVTDPTVDSQIVILKEAGANVLLTAGVSKFAAQAIRKVHDIGWKPLHVLAHPAASIPATFRPAGLEASTGIVSAEFVKQPGDPAWANDPEMLAYLDVIKKYAPELDPSDKLVVFGYYQAAATAKIFEMCGDTLTRESIMNKVSHLNRLEVPMFLPGITMNTTPDDYVAIKQMQLQRFNGTGWDKIGGIVEG